LSILFGKQSNRFARKQTKTIMKQLQHLILFLFFSTTNVFAQLTVVGSSEYGRIFDITYDSTVSGKLYAATMGNHIVVSENNGLSWELLYSYPQPGIIIKELKLSAGHKLTFTTYNPNGYQNNIINVLSIASLNIVQTIEIPIPASATSSHISAYDIYSADSDVAIVQQYYEEGFTLKAKVYYTDNAGSTWSEIYDNTANDFIFPANVAVSPGNPQKLFIACQGGLDVAHIGGLLISADAGTTWEEKLPGIDFKPMAFNPQNPDEVILGTTVGSQIQNLLRSTNGGETWATVDGNWTANVSGAIITIRYNPANPANLIILAEQDIITTADGLQTIEFYHHEDGLHNPEGNTNYYYGTNASFNPFTAGEIYISCNYFPVFTADGGATVTRAKQPFFFSPEFTAYTTTGAQSHLYYGVQNGFVHQDLNNSIQAPAFVRSVASFSNWDTEFFTDKNVVGRTYNYVSSFLGAGLNISNDHGATNLSIPATLPYMQLVESLPGNPNLIWYSVSDYGGISSAFELDISNPDSPQQVEVALPAEDFLSAMYFNAGTMQRWIALGPNIYRSAAASSGWELQSSGLESLVSGVDRIFQITSNPALTNEMALATSQGIFTSDDGGVTWVHTGTFPNEGVHLIGYPALAPGNMVAVTYDTEFTTFKIRYSSDAGQQWSEVPAAGCAFITSYSAALKFGLDDATVFLSTTDLGLVSYHVNFPELAQSDFTAHQPVNIYPNPTADYICVELQGDRLSDVSVFSITGQKLIESTHTKIDVSALPSGVYFMKIKAFSGKTTTRKFIKQ
jgi:type IX secretion system substrate protein